MFRAIILPIFRNTTLCVTACGIMHPRCCQLATSWVHYTKSCPFVVCPHSFYMSTTLNHKYMDQTHRIFIKLHSKTERLAIPTALLTFIQVVSSSNLNQNTGYRVLLVFLRYGKQVPEFFLDVTIRGSVQIISNCPPTPRLAVLSSPRKTAKQTQSCKKHPHNLMV